MSLHRNEEILFRLHGARFVKGRVLEISPDPVLSKTQLITDGWQDWHTLGLTNEPGLTYPGCSEYSYPIPDGSYDTVLATSVLEHVRHPWEWFREIARILKVGGHVVTTSPISWPLHRVPVDCWRVFPDGIRALHEWAGLETVLALQENVDYEDTSVVDVVAVGKRT